VRLRDRALLESYRSDDCNIVDAFYVPCMQASTRFSRAVGFFSSSALSAAAKGVHALIERGGTMRLIASPQLSPEDASAIETGYSGRDETLGRVAAGALGLIPDAICRRRLEALAWLITHGALDIQLAVVDSAGGRGIYHEKVGIFEDDQGDFVAFSGSPNESASGLVSNFECVDVFCSWKPEDATRALQKRDAFERLWRNDTRGLEVVPFPDAAKRELLQLTPAAAPDSDPESEPVVRGVPTVPRDVKLRGYQRDAINNWLAAGGRGTLQMATGAGKTFTALGLATKLFTKDMLRAFVVIAPYRHLVRQWAGEAAKFGFDPVECHESKQVWVPKAQARVRALLSGAVPTVTLITTNATLTGDSFQGVLRSLPANTLIVGDEAHNLGARKLAASLPQYIEMRLALSATPERHFDDEGTQLVFDYFGEVIEPQFTISDALAAGALVPYRYHPIPVPLSDEEAEDYAELSEKISRLWSDEDDSPTSDALKLLLLKRARLIAAAEGKVDALRSVIGDLAEVSHTLVYCGDGRVESDLDATEQRQVDEVTRVLGHDLGLRVAKYTADTPLGERQALRSRFASGEVQALVAIRCLDEGVDIPETRRAIILASSTNPRQFIQRRGRVLRPCAGKERAEIFDMIVVPPGGTLAGDEGYHMERRLVAKELERFMEFADLAQNPASARQALADIRDRYGLLDR